MHLASRQLARQAWFRRDRSAAHNLNWILQEVCAFIAPAVCDADPRPRARKEPSAPHCCGMSRRNCAGEQDSGSPSCCALVVTQPIMLAGWLDGLHAGFQHPAAADG